MSTDTHSSFNMRQVETFASKLRRRQIVGSRTAARETVLLLRSTLAKARFSSFEQLTDIIKCIGRMLISVQPKEHTVGNVIRRLLHQLREEAVAILHINEVQTVFSISRFVRLGQPRLAEGSKNRDLDKLPAPPTRSNSVDDDDPDDDPDAFAKGFKPVVMEALQDIFDELDTVYDSISKNAKDHIHSDEIILTVGNSKTVEAFLQAAANHRNYNVIVAETAPSYAGRETAKALSAAGVSTFLVPDSSIYALMSRVNKVIIGAHAILANGGMFATSGSRIVATAARAHHTPVVVCAGQFKMTPFWNLYHEYGSLDFGNPDAVLGFVEGNLVDKVDVVNPYYDYVPPELIDAFITNDGDHPPASVYRLLKETYGENNDL